VLSAIRSGCDLDIIAAAFRIPPVSEANAEPGPDLRASISALRTGLNDAVDAGAQGELTETVRAVGDAAGATGLSLTDLISTDLHDLRSRPYLRSYFANLHS
jgi:hypothetical protein